MSDDMQKLPPENEELESVEVEIVKEDLQEGETEAAKTVSSNEYFRKLMTKNFLEYASYVIKDRAIPDVDDGMKPVQRRILWAMHRVDDGGTKKAAFVVGEVMGKYHPHGDASIQDALVVIANKEYFIKKQGNFGNIISGSPAAAARYIECGLTPLAKDVLFNDDITDTVDTYDGRNQEPILLPVKIPVLLMQGSDGIAVGMATKIMPHNFNEVIKAQIAVLKNEPFELYPDFLQGGIMNVSEYDDGNGKIVVRAKIDIDGRDVVIREIPYTTTTNSLMESIDKAIDKGKIKISNIIDLSATNVEIRITPMRGQDPEKVLNALYMYTDCQVPISVNLTVIRDRRPAQMSVHEVIRRNTEKLLWYLMRELEVELTKLNESFHAKTLAQIFFENRIYKKIEDCGSEEEEYREVYEGLQPFLDRTRREVTNDDIDKLLALPVRRIARFDIEKNERELREIDERIAQVKHKLKHLRAEAISYLQGLLKKYGHLYPRRTEIVTQFDKIDRQKTALNNIKIGWDRREGYIGTSIKSDDVITCNEFDHLLKVKKNGEYTISDVPSEKKLFVDKLYECRKYDSTQEFAIVYTDVKTKKYYGKRTCIDKFIKDKKYMLCPQGCKLELLTPRPDAIYEMVESMKKGEKKTLINLMEFPLRAPRARGFLLGSYKLEKLTHQRYLTDEELEEIRSRIIVDEDNEEEEQEEDIPTEETSSAFKVAPVKIPHSTMLDEEEKSETSTVEFTAETEKIQPHDTKKSPIENVEISEETAAEAGNADESEAEITAADIENAESEQQEINTPAEAIAETVSETAVETEDKTETAEPEQNTENPQTKTEEIEQEKTLQAETPPPQEEKIKPVMPVFDTPPILSERAKEILKRSRKKRKDGDDDDNDILQPELFL